MTKDTIDSIYDLENLKSKKGIISDNTVSGTTIIQSENKVTPLNIQDFIYPKKNHLDYFNEKEYSLRFYGNEIEEENANIKKFRNLLSYSFITENIKEGSDILEICNEPESMLLDHFKLRYDCYILTDIDQLDKPDNYDHTSVKLNKYREEEISGEKNKFQFIVWNSSFNNISDNPESIKNTLQSVFNLLKPGGFIFFLFDGFNTDDSLFIHNAYFNILNLKSDDLKNVSWYIDYDTIKKDHEQLKYKKDSASGGYMISKERVFIKEGFISSYNLLLRKYPLQLNKVTKSKVSDFRKKTPAYIYHHLMKCGGTSVTMALQDWFKLELDHIDVGSHKIELNHYLKFKLNLEVINSDSCIVSHFHFDGTFLHQRYPEVLNPNNNFRIFTFVREPLALRVSLYYFERKRGGFKNLTLKSYIKSSGTNFLAKLFPCDESNYKEVLDRYFFIGITEKMQESIDKLGKLINGKKIVVPMVNTSQKDKQLEELGPEYIDNFKEKNKLEYLIYDYCLEKFNKI